MDRDGPIDTQERMLENEYATILYHRVSLSVVCNTMDGFRNDISLGYH